MSVSVPDWMWKGGRLRDRNLQPSLDERSQGAMAWMFVEDVYTRSASFRYRGRDRDRVLLHFHDEAAASNLPSILLRYGGARNGQLASVVGQFIEQTCQVLAERGELMFEVIRNPTLGEAPRFVLNPIYGPRVYKVGQVALQFVRDVVEGGRRRVLYVRSPDYWRILLPKRFGGTRRHRQLIDLLADQSAVAPDFYIQDLAAAESNGFDFAEFQWRKHIALARATRSWGWSGRSTWGDSVLEYYRMEREVLFREATSGLVEHVVEEFNGFLTREGIACEVSIRELPKREHYQQVLAQLRAGEISFADAYDAIEVD